MDTTIREYAKAGMRAEIDKRSAELEQLRTAYSKLVGRSTGRPRAAGAAMPVKRRRRKMSAAARKATSERMRKYWADRRKAEKTK
jgi:hypothetical protein